MGGAPHGEQVGSTPPRRDSFCIWVEKGGGEGPRKTVARNAAPSVARRPPRGCCEVAAATGGQVQRRTVPGGARDIAQHARRNPDTHENRRGLPPDAAVQPRGEIAQPPSEGPSRKALTVGTIIESGIQGRGVKVIGDVRRLGEARRRSGEAEVEVVERCVGGSEIRGGFLNDLEHEVRSIRGGFLDDLKHEVRSIRGGFLDDLEHEVRSIRGGFLF